MYTYISGRVNKIMNKINWTEREILNSAVQLNRCGLLDNNVHEIAVCAVHNDVLCS